MSTLEIEFGGQSLELILGEDTAACLSARQASEVAAALAGRYANDDTDTDVVGGAVGERGAKYWADDAETRGAAQVALAAGQVTLATTAKTGAELAQLLSEQARDINQALVGVDYADLTAAEAGSVDGDFFTYWDGDNIVYAKNVSGVVSAIVGPWFDQDKVGEKTVTALKDSTEAARGEGSLWKADKYRYQEANSAATDHHLTTAGGVKLYVLPGSDGALHTGALGPQAGLEATTALNALIASAENGVLYFDYDPIGYLTNSIIFPSSVAVWGDPGTYIGKVTGGIRVFQINGVTDVHVNMYGATINGNNTGTSHTLYINNSQRVTVNGLAVIGAGTTGDDCIYLGGDPLTDALCREIVFHDVTCEGLATTRSGLVLAAVHGFTAYNCKFSNGGGSMENSNAMDMEPNKWMSRDKDGQSAVQNVWFYNCDFHGSREQGAALGGNNINFFRCRFYDNGKQGAATSSNPYVTDFAKYRTGDLLGVSAVSTADGWVTVTTGTAGVDLLIDDFGIDTGAIIGIFGTNNGASWPTGLTGRMVIAEIDSTQSKIRVAADYIYDKKTSLSGGSYSTLDNDPEVSDLYIAVSTRLGVNSNITFTDCEWFDNCQDGVINNADLSLSFGYNIRVIRPRIRVNAVAVGHDGIVAPYSYGTFIDSPDITGVDRAAGATSKGISLSVASKYTVLNPDIRNLGRSGIILSGLTESRLEGGRVLNCGTTLGPAVSIQTGDRGRTTGLVVRNDDSHRSSTANGYHVQNTVTNHSVTGVQTWGHPSDDPFRLQGTGHIVNGCFENGTRIAELETATATNIALASATINTAGKFTGKQIKDTTNNRLMVSRGALATSIWDVADGSASVTPA